MTTTQSVAGKIAAQIAERQAKLAARRQQLTDDQAEIVAMEQELRWAEGQARRDRLTDLAEQARTMATATSGSMTEIQAAAVQVADGIRYLGDLIDAHNQALSDLRKKIATEGVARATVTPPDARDGGVGIHRETVVVDHTHINPLERAEVVARAVAAADTPNDPTVPSPIIERRAATGPFWRDRTSGNVVAADTRPNAGCDEVTRADYLSHLWRCAVRDLPAPVIDTLTDAERAAIAPQLLPADTP